MKRNSKISNYATQQRVLNNANDVINRETDTMNFLLDLKSKFKLEQKCSTPIKRDQKYSQIQKRRNTSNSSEVSSRSALIKSLNKVVQQAKMNTSKPQTPNESKSQRKQPEGSQNASYIMLEHQYNDLVKKIHYKDKIIADQQERLNQSLLIQKSIYAINNEQQELTKLKALIDYHYHGECGLSYEEKIKQILSNKENQEEEEDQIMSLILDQKELQCKIEDLVDKNAYLEQGLSQMDSLKAQKETLQEQNTVLTQKIAELSQMYDDIVVKYEAQIKQLEVQLQEIQQQPSNVSHSMIEFQFNIQKNSQYVSSGRDSEQLDLKDFMEFQQPPQGDSNREKINPLEVQNAHLKYVVDQLQSKDSFKKIILQELFIKFLKSKLQQENENKFITNH